MRHLGYVMCGALAVAFVATGSASADKKYGPGASDTDIKIGNISPYSGPASGYATIAKAQAAYFRMINESGGINGRKINYISYDDAYSPPKTVEQARKLVESDEVLFLLSPLGTPGNSAIHKYMNQKKVPHVFLTTGASKWDDPKHFPWTMGFLNNYRSEADIYAQYILRTMPEARIGVLYQNDDFGKDYLAGLREGLGERARQIVAEIPFELSTPTVEPMVVALKAANPDVVFHIGTPKFVAQGIKKVAELGWKPVQFLPNTATSIVNTLRPAGLDNSQGVLSASYLKDSTDPKWASDPAMTEWYAFMDKWYPDGNKSDSLNVYAYVVAQVTVQLLKQAGDDLSRDNIMKQAANLDLVPGLLLPGIRVKTGPDDYRPLQQMQMIRFKGESWEPFGNLLDSQK
ncbi:MAG: ABC transporter substrate-binding protein [Afipia sp.]|jgi:branched-chain amino acid transport system substrate-binding protein|nr:ABC transporter substrate-binding protein [Afipia sp.]